MNGHRPNRTHGRVESILTIIIVGCIFTLVVINEPVCWKIATAFALILWLVSKQIARRRIRKKEIVQSDKIVELSKFADFGRMSTGLFHDLMSPLSAIVLTLQDIDKDIHPKIEDIKDHLTKSVMASRRMDELMRGIKKKMRSDDSQRTFSADDVIREAIGLFRYKAMRESVTVTFSVLPIRFEIFGNPMKFSQIIENLISNAIDAYAEFPLGTSETPVRREILIALKSKKRKLIIQIEDWGSGIDPSTVPKIFNAFFTTKTPDTGLGLGLWISKEIVENEFGGSIRVSSVLGQGTKFDVTIPRRKEH